jgi:precorrin-6B methylase 2
MKIKMKSYPNTTFSSNPIKQFYYKFIKRQNPYSLEAVEELLGKFKNNVHLIKGNSNKVLKKIDMSKIDYVFLDGGHEYNTVLNDLNCCYDVVNNNGTVLCDDYDLKQAPGVRKAIDDFVKEQNFNCSIICNGRFARIEKN